MNAIKGQYNYALHRRYWRIDFGAGVYSMRTAKSMKD